MVIIKSVYLKCRQQARSYGVPLLAVLLDYVNARIRYGFCGEDYFRNTDGFALKNFQKADVFTYKRWLKVVREFNDTEYVYLLNDKVAFLKYFRKYIKHDFIYPKETTFEKFSEFVLGHRDLLEKPICDNQGHGVREFVHSGNLYQQYQDLIKYDSFLESRILQHPSMTLGSKSVNTVRVYTFLDSNGQAHILKVVLRVGVGNSIIDNYHAGGVIYSVNPSYGFVESYGISRVYGNDICYQPGTEILMLGFQIPNYNILIDTIRKAAEDIPQIRYIGWDVAITDDGVDLIEANHDADHALFSIIGNEKLFYGKILSYK